MMHTFKKTKTINNKGINYILSNDTGVRVTITIRLIFEMLESLKRTFDP